MFCEEPFIPITREMAAIIKSMLDYGVNRACIVSMLGIDVTCVDDIQTGRQFADVLPIIDRQALGKCCTEAKVAPYAGAWIETSCQK